MIGVKNDDNKRLVARYDGEDITFEPGVVTAVSEQAARHIFGYCEKDKTRALLRLGWLPNGANMEAAIERLTHFKFMAMEVKVKEEITTALPRGVSDAEQPENRPLSPEEEAHAKKLAHQEGATKKFAKS